MPSSYKVIIMSLGISLLSCSSKTATPGPSGNTGTDNHAVTDKTYLFDTTPTWAEEFNTGSQPDTSKWGYDIGGDGWGNHEMEYYTNGNNVAINNGNLIITTRKENVGSNKYSSARLFSKGAGNFTYGRIEVRAKIPGGKGTWPAIWMLPTDNAYGAWPNSGEMDMMEHVGYDPYNIYVTMHTGAYNHTINTQKGVTINVPTAISDYHTYRIDWTPASVTAFIDDNQVMVFKNEGTGYMVWPFDKRFHLMLNVAVGGDWGGLQGVDDSSFPCTMQIDYIRIYKVTNL
ncbi:glycoside hydrolase family 16 protein [Mucilaginibacter polytrichastri]|uniref:Beta-glucanase n=1 Tax=Mucilaginibacter polytrichastri TaxID=1302689 RepID=A0A1Q6A5P8_9SPHI|nr:glycoside hydrolase family 16 protein [Mucilaginibacter polytrichastri]OKS89334.1 Beta-glucanase [Mucilaginibacter polytrichastri]SFS74365.1 Beta-glucanase, GH16 family [Mucilaginibacter polytrichastri]